MPLLARREADGSIALRAPRVGVWSAAPAAGTLVGPGSPAGALVQLGRREALVVPDGVAGRVEIDPHIDRKVGVGYGDVLFVVRPAEAVPTAEGTTSERGRRGKVLPSPTDGVFYRSPSPGAAPFVSPGDRIATGQPVGLVEVMKTFSPIVYGGPGMPDSAEIVELLVSDGEEIRAGQPLIAVR